MLRAYVILPPDARERLRRADPAAKDEAKRALEKLARRFARGGDERIFLSFLTEPPPEARSGLAMRIIDEIDGIGVIEVGILGDFLGNDLPLGDLFPPQ